MCQNKPHNICHSEGSHSCSWTHTVLHWGQSHCCIHILLHKVCCSSVMQEGQCRLLDKHWCMDCNDCWEGMQQLRNNKKHCINNHNAHETIKATWNHYSIIWLFWASGNCGRFLKTEILFLFYYQKQEEKIVCTREVWLFNPESWLLSISKEKLCLSTLELVCRWYISTSERTAKIIIYSKPIKGKTSSKTQRWVYNNRGISLIV